MKSAIASLAGSVALLGCFHTGPTLKPDAEHVTLGADEAARMARAIAATTERKYTPGGTVFRLRTDGALHRSLDRRLRGLGYAMQGQPGKPSAKDAARPATPIRLALDALGPTHYRVSAWIGEADSTHFLFLKTREGPQLESVTQGRLR